MTMMAEDYLMAVQATTAAIKRRRDEMERMRSLAFSVTQDITPRESCRTPMVSDRTGDNILALMEAEDAYAKALDDAAALRVECAGLIDELNDRRYQDVLHKRYMLDMGWKEIAADMGYTYHHVHKLHSKALDRFQEVLDKDKETDK